MLFYVNNFKYVNLLFCGASLTIGLALYLSNINYIFKFVLIIIGLTSNYKTLLQQKYIIGIYLDLDSNKSLLLTRSKQQIKVNFSRIEYYSNFFIIIRLVNNLKIFRILIFNNQIEKNLFKSLIILAKYNYLPTVKS